MEVEGHEPLDAGSDTFQLGLVGKHVLGLGERRDEVGLGRGLGPGASEWGYEKIEGITPTAVATVPPRLTDSP